MRVVMPDLRCAVTTVHQQGADAGEQDKTLQPLTHLKSARKAKLRDGAIFGTKLNLIGLHCGRD